MIHMLQNLKKGRETVFAVIYCPPQIVKAFQESPHCHGSSLQDVEL